MPKLWEISKDRKYQKSYDLRGKWIPYKKRADRERKRIMREKKKLEKNMAQTRSDAKFVTPPPIDPIVVEKKKFLTPYIIDAILIVVIMFLWQSLLVIYLIDWLVPEPTTNTVIVKVKEKVVYKKPIKKITTNVCNK